MELTNTEHTALTLNFVIKKTDKIIVFYSGGKDSIVLIDICAKHFKEVHAVFMYFIKDLEHQQPLLNYLKKYNNVTLHQYPHWMLSHFYKRSHMRFHNDKQNERIKIIKASDIENKARIDTGCEWLASGERRSDSLKRFMFLGMQKFDSICENMKHIYPLSHWNKGEIMAYTKLHRLIKSVSYNPKANSDGVSIDLKTLLYLRDNHISDYKKMIKMFPFAEKQIFEYDYEKSINENQTSEI